MYNDNKLCVTFKYFFMPIRIKKSINQIICTQYLITFFLLKYFFLIYTIKNKNATIIQIFSTKINYRFENYLSDISLYTTEIIIEYNYLYL